MIGRICALMALVTLLATALFWLGLLLVLSGCGLLAPDAPRAPHCTAPPAYNLYACTLPTPLTAYDPGQLYAVTVSVTNTLQPFVSFNGLPPRPLMRLIGLQVLQGVPRWSIRKGQTVHLCAVAWAEALVLVPASAGPDACATLNDDTAGKLVQR